jgi:hypothetical protein
MYDGLCDAHGYVQSRVIMEQQHSTLFCCGMNSKEGEHSGLLVLEYGSQSSVLSPLVRCAQELCHSHPKKRGHREFWMDSVVTSSLKS